MAKLTESERIAIDRLEAWLDYYHDVVGTETCDRSDPLSPTISDLRALLKLVKRRARTQNTPDSERGET